MEEIFSDFTENLIIKNGSSNATQTFKSKTETITYTAFKVCFYASTPISIYLILSMQKHLSDLKTDGVAYVAEDNAGWF